MTIVEAKDELMCYSELDTVLKQLSETLVYLKNRAEQCTYKLAYKEYTRAVGRGPESSWAELMETEGRYMAYQHEIEAIRQEISARIAKLPAQSHYILFMRYIKRVSTEDICKKKKLSQRTIYRQHSKAIKEYAQQYSTPVLSYGILRNYVGTIAHI